MLLECLSELESEGLDWEFSLLFSAIELISRFEEALERALLFVAILD